MKLDYLFDACFKHSAGGFGTLDTLTPEYGMRTGPISLHTAITAIPSASADSQVSLQVENIRFAELLQEIGFVILERPKTYTE